MRRTQAIDFRLMFLIPFDLLTLLARMESVLGSSQVIAGSSLGH